MIVGIVGSEEAKFTIETKKMSIDIIRQLLARPNVTAVCSGGCHLGGIDIWAEEVADEFGIDKLIFVPKTLSWEKGYKPRNINIAENSDEVNCITVKTLPENYVGMRFIYCYHCKTYEHIKSGGCWTAKYAKSLGKVAKWHVV